LTPENILNKNNASTSENTDNKKNEEQILEIKKSEDFEEKRMNEMELTDKPLKSVFLFGNMKDLPINCSEKDSITYKIGKLQISIIL
jgi:hypothetical protein